MCEGTENHPKYQESLMLKQRVGSLRGGGSLKELGQMTKRLKKLNKNLEEELIGGADVILATCVGTGAATLKNLTFPLVVVDECTQSTEPACLIPLTKSSERAVLIGDHCQLPPTITINKLTRSGLSISMFERLLDVYNPQNPDNPMTMRQNQMNNPSNPNKPGLETKDWRSPMGLAPVSLLVSIYNNPNNSSG